MEPNKLSQFEAFYLKKLRKECKKEYKEYFYETLSKRDNVLDIDREKIDLIREKYIHKLNFMVDNIANTRWYKYTMRRIERYYDQMQQNFENIDDTIIFYNEWKDEKKQIKDDEEND